MSYVNEQKLQECFDSLWMLIADEQKGDPEEISFRSGYIDKQEGYKSSVLEKAKNLKEAFHWEEPGVIGSGRILSLAVELLKIRPHDDKKPHNLVDYRDVRFFKSLQTSNREKFEEIERLLYILYTDNRDEEVFRALTHVLGERYPLISYFFFLKDSEKYQVVRPKNFAWRFRYIDSPVACVKKCSWENYEIYNAILKEVQNFLIDCLDVKVTDCIDDRITLTDAHSFIWMFWMFEKKKWPECNMPANEDGNCTTVIISAKEGKRVLYYTSKYERNPKLRTEALRLHGYSCTACGFNFEERYGALGKDFIEVHHTKPLYSMDGETEVHPETDLIPLCSNCHWMIHRKRNAILTVANLREAMRTAKRK